MKYFIVTKDTELLLEGAVVCETGLKKLQRLTNGPVEFEQTTEFNANSYEYVQPHEIDSDPRCGERNVFHDHNGNEFHN